MQITKITVDVVTGESDHAETDGDVYLGIGGREFHLDVAMEDDFEAGDDIRYVFGEEANIADADRNDPRKHSALTVEAVERCPVYIRFQPVTRNDDWQVTQVRVAAHGDGQMWRFAAPMEFGEMLWLGRKSGLVLHLRRL